MVVVVVEAVLAVVEGAVGGTDWPMLPSLKIIIFIGIYSTTLDN